MKKEFYITKCECGGVDGSILKTPSYDCTRDLMEWTKEGRYVTLIKVDKSNPFPRRCRCHDGEDEEILIAETK